VKGFLKTEGWKKIAIPIPEALYAKTEKHEKQT